MVQGNQIASINACAAYFAQADYHVTVSFYRVGCNCEIFFSDIKKKETIYTRLLCFADADDKIVFNKLKLRVGTTYSLCLIKTTLL